MKMQGSPTARTDRDGTLPLVTIGITCFNAADTIGRAIDSALKQDWPNKEILIVDDASTDGSENQLREISHFHPELRVIRRKTNEGYADALNCIIGQSQGEFLAIFDDDDESRPDRVTKQWKRITAYERAHNADLVLCYANRNVVRHGQTEVSHAASAIGREAPEPNGRPVASYLFGYLAEPQYVWGMLGSCTLMARRRIFEVVGAFDPNFRRSAELDFAIRAALHGAHFIAVNEPLITQYKTPGGEKSGTVPLEYALKLRHKYRDFLAGENVYLASLAMAHAWFHGNAGRAWKSRLFMALSYALLPSAILAAKFRSRILRRATNGVN
jgi:glycosyltransferase involved in cell wall biosynthesis